MSPERIDSLFVLSDAAYDAIDTPVGGELVSRRIVRLGMAVVSQTIERPYGIRLAGDHYHRLVVRELQTGGLSPEDDSYDPWPRYRNATRELPPYSFPAIDDRELDDLAVQYAAVERLTKDRSGGRETNASHVAHLSALCLPYAAEHYPELDQARVALYCLIHDILEAYVGDTPSLGATDEAMILKDTNEAAALERIKKEFGERYPTLVQAIVDYEHLADDESKYVKTFDKLDPGFTHYYSHGSTLIEDLGFTNEQVFRRNVDIMTRRIIQAGYARDFPELLHDRDRLTDYIIETTPWDEA